MLDPNYLLHISEGAEEIAEQLHTDIVNRIVNRIVLRIGRGDGYILTAQDKWQIENLQQAGYLLEDIQKDIAKATKLQQSEIAEAMEEAGVKALDYDDKIYQSVGRSPTPLTQSPELIRLMQRSYEATLGEWTNFTRTTVDEAQRLFINQLDRAYTLVSTGALSYTEAVKEIINSITSDGVKITYPTGKTDTIETAALRAVRTGISQATAQIQTARMNEMDVDLVIVSSHLGARPSHQEWQGKIFSRSGVSKYPNFIESTGYGSVSGLCGVNCRHSFSPYFEGMDNPFEHFDSEENQEQYEKEQYQRTLERRIRQTKREVMGKKEAVDSCKDERLKFELDMDYQRKAALLQKQNAAYKEYCERNQLKPLSDRISVARWDRKQAAAARGAAKRYANAHGGSVANNIISIEKSNEIATNAIKKSYEHRRIDKGISRVPYDELDGKSVAQADFTGMEDRLAEASAKQFAKLSDEYETMCESIVVGELDAASAPAGTSYQSNIQSAKITFNESIVKDGDKFRERMKKAVENGQFPKVDAEQYDKYVITHEFAHTLMDFESPLKNLVNADTSHIKKARQEIKAIEEAYRKELRELELTYRAAEKKALETFDPDDWDASVKIQEKIKAKTISKYADMGIDEFMAEAFADAKIGSAPSEYSKKVEAVIDKYFKKTPLENMAKSGTIKSRNISNRNMANGQRRSPSHILTDREIESVLQDAKDIGIPMDVLKFNVGNRTGFSDLEEIIHIRGDVLPDTNSRNLRDLLSQKAVLAHEYYGHYKAHPSKFRIDDWRDEFRASYRAAIDTPNLSDEDRRMLMLDAYDRAKEAGVKVNYNSVARMIIYGYE